ncbi:5-methylcytosine restriction system specificity protein McrC [Ruoffia tabacinasalis]|uniref:5-methylcytosine restriction system specificity protein McrC n=1 Tax=Ruoffia tabacinasalis TaxID=87458 RepID=UPI003F9E11B4
MNKQNNILIKNIYYMLSYAFKALQQSNYESVDSEVFENIYDLFAEILIKGLNKQLKQGLYKEYIDKREDLSTIRGKIILRDSIQNKIQRKLRMACEYDELSEDNQFNQIIKMTIMLLIKEESVKKEKKVKLKKILLYFSEINMISPEQIKWESLRFQRNNQTYQMLLNICRFVIEGLLLTNTTGSYKMLTFTEQQLNALFERFVLEYYRKHFLYLKPSAPYVNWNLLNENGNEGLGMLPRMKTDIKLCHNNFSLIIDTKFYKDNLNKFDKIISENLYQIFSYVKNEDKQNSGNVSGMLLYAQTANNRILDYSYNMNKNYISIKSINLNEDFGSVQAQLDKIITEWMSLVEKVE